MKRVISFIIALVMIVSTFSLVASADVGDNYYYESESNNSYSSANRIYNDYTISGTFSYQYDMDYYVFTLYSAADVYILCNSTRSTVMMGLYNSSQKIVTASDSTYRNGYYYNIIDEHLSAGTYYITLLQDSSYSNLSYLMYFIYESSSSSSSSSSSTTTPPTTSHTHKYDEEIVYPTCTKEGYTIYECSCGDSYTDDYTDTTDHNESEWLYYHEPECGSYSERYKECLDCGVTIEEEYVEIPHEKSDWIIDYNASCSKNGLKYIKCLNCGEILDEEEIPAGPHDESDWIIDFEPTCEFTGLKHTECLDCGVTVREEDILRTNHVEKVIPFVVPDCVNPGRTAYVVCAVCDEVIEGYDVVPAYGHKIVTIPAKAATVSSTGLTEGKKCSVCGEVTVKQKTVERKKLTKVTGLKATKTTADSVTLSWKKVTGAESYSVMYSTDGKKWKTVKSTKTKATVKKLTSGKTYRFKVKAVAGKYSGSTSSVVKATTKVAKAVISKLTSANTTSATVTWKKVTNANGYVVEYSTSNKFTSKTTKKVTIKKGSTTKTTLKKLKSGTKYFVRVKAYKTVNKKAVYGAYSSVKSVTTKKAAATKPESTTKPQSTTPSTKPESTTKPSTNNSTANAGVVDALKKCERYAEYIRIDLDILKNAVDLYKMTGNLNYFVKIEKTVLEIDSYLSKIRGYCQPYSELYMLYNESDIDLPIFSTSSVSSVNSYARKAGYVPEFYDILCDRYGL